MSVLSDLYEFYLAQQRCGDLDGGVEDDGSDRAWLYVLLWSGDQSNLLRSKD
jgi:hypothetical protein